MKILIKIFKGATVGLGSILPGISGGMIAAVFNIYEDLIVALNNFVKEPVKSIANIWEYLVGIILGLGLGVVAIATIYNHFPIPITMLFIGFILGGIPSTIKATEGKKKVWYHYLISIIMALVMISILFLRPNSIDTSSRANMYLLYSVIGFLIALPIVVPGVSGTMILMTLGLYTYMTGALSDFIKAFVTLNGQGILTTIVPAMTIVISAFIGLLVFAKVIYYFLKNHKTGFNMGILGVLVISPINILWSLYLDNEGIFVKIGVLNIIASILLFIVGMTVAYKVAALNNNSNNIIEENEGDLIEN